MDSKALASLISAIECGSIAKASRQQGITAAAVSQRIQVLEEMLGTTLLNRMGHTAKPTDAAMAILPRARRIVRDVELLRSDIQTNTLSGSMKMGSISTVLTGILPRALLSLHHEAPDIRPQITPVPQVHSMMRWYRKLSMWQLSYSLPLISLNAIAGNSFTLKS